MLAVFPDAFPDACRVSGCVFGRFWELSLSVKWEFLFYYFRRKTLFEETILSGRLQAKVPHPK